MDPLRWFPRLLKLLPADFQADYGRDMERTFAAQHRDAARIGARGVASLWRETLIGLLRTAPREHASQLAQDTRYALRMIGRAPAFAAVAVLTLAVGIGANTAMFSVAHALLLRPLPFPDADRLVRLYESSPRSGLIRNSVSGPNLLDWQRETTAYTAVAAYRSRSMNLSGTGGPRYVHGARASASFFDVLGMPLARGRAFAEAEDRALSRVAVISHALWQAQFGGRDAAIGGPIDLDGERFTVIGVLPAGFEFQLESDVWIPLGMYPGTTAGRGSHNLQVIARLRDGSDVARAQAELSALAARLEQQYPGTNKGWTAFVEPLHDSTVHAVRPLALILAGAVGFVLLVACANIGSLLVARAAGRGREFAVRIAMGANRVRLVRQLLTESLILASLGGAAGAALAAALVEALKRFEAFPVPRLHQVTLDGSVLAVTLGLTVATGILFGVAPALHVARCEFGGGRAARGATAGRERRRLQAALNVAQMAVGVVLLAGAGLMIRTLIELRGIDAGFDPAGLVAIDLSLSDGRYPRTEDGIRFFEQVVDGAREVPGVTDAALVSDPPLTGGVGHWSNSFTVEGRPPNPPGQDDFAYLRWATPGYFRLVGVPLLRGRMFSTSDVLGRPNVVVVNDAFVRRHFPAEDPIGRRLVIHFSGSLPREIVGVVGDLRQTSLDAEPSPQMYVPYAQALIGSGTLLVRAQGSVRSIADGVRDAIRRIDPDQPIFNVRPFEADVSRSIAPRRVAMQVLTVFAAIAVVLAVVGIYAVSAYQVGERRREIGVRMALGARAADILRMVVRQGMSPAVAGVVIGLAGAAVLTRVLESMLVGTQPLDPVTFAATAAVLLVAALAACAVPARRATRVDPNLALRSE